MMQQDRVGRLVAAVRRLLTALEREFSPQHDETLVELARVYAALSALEEDRESGP